MLFATVYCVFFHFVCVIRCFVTSISLFFLMIRRPPRSTRTDTLVPYTTLFRSTLIVNGHNDIMVPTINSFTLQQHIPNARLIQIGRAHVRTPVTNAHLVCRLLLEKKNKKTYAKHDSNFKYKHRITCSNMKSHNKYTQTLIETPCPYIHTNI